MSINMTGLTSHHFEGRSIRTSTNDEGEPLFIARDVCDVLDLVWSDTQKTLPDWAKGPLVTSSTGGVIHHPNGVKREFATLTEGGLYECIFRSRKPEAREFRRWVCCEVLPQLRKTGVFIPGATASERAEALRQLLLAERAIARAEAKKARVLAEGPIPRKSVAQRQDAYPRPEGWVTIPEFVRAKLGEGNLHIERCGKSLGWKCRDAIEGETCAWVQGSSTQKRRAYPPAFLEERWPQVLLATGVIVSEKEGA